MATKRIGDYTAAISIDGSTNYLLIQPGSASTAYNKINRNVFLGVTGQPMDISSSQSVTNKTLDNTNTITLKDTLFTLQDDGDATKQARFQLSGITTATTRTYTLPNASSTLADIATVQTFTNKTLTSPTITGGSIDNSTVTVDAISGHTTANSGTIYGVAITAAKIPGTSIAAGTIGSTVLATNAVQASQLATNAITLGYAQITANVTGITSTTGAQVTGLTTTVTIPAGSRRIEIIADVGDVFISTATASITLSIWDGVVGSGTQIGRGTVTCATVNSPYYVHATASVTPSAGSKTYNVGLSTSNGSNAANLEAGTTFPAYITVRAV